MNLSLISELRRKWHALLPFDETVRSENAIVLFCTTENQVVANRKRTGRGWAWL